MAKAIYLIKNSGKAVIYKLSMITVILLGSSILFPGCKHEPLVPFVKDDNGNGNGNGNGTGSGIPCDPNVVYFDQQILPFLVSSCAKAGCHNASSAQEGVILDSYGNVMSTGDVTPFNLNDSEIWEVINETDPDKIMPPPGEIPLTQAQINLIALWINQGAQNLVCDDLLGPCDSTSVSFVADVTPILQNKCVGCHSSATSTNFFINLSNYAGVSAAAATGQLLGSVTHNPNYNPMPKGGPILNTCEIAKIRNWISEGIQNN